VRAAGPPCAGIRAVAGVVESMTDSNPSSAPPSLPPTPTQSLPEGEPLETAVLFVDLVSSSDFASVLGLKEYARYIDSFEQLCRIQCEHFFRVAKKYDWKSDHVPFEVQFLGDELIVYMHTDKRHRDVYQLLALAITLKCGWLGTALNKERVAAGAPSAELAAGIHVGSVWAQRNPTGYKRRGFTINVGKRVESASREGQNFRIYVSDPAMKRVNRQIRNVLFSPRKIVQMKGVVVPVGVYEVMDSFINPASRLEPSLFEGFANVAQFALDTNAFDLWIHSCLQVADEARNGKKVTDQNLERCRHILNIDPKNACALHHLAQGLRDRKEFETALLVYQDLTSYWPGFADGWLEMGKLLKMSGDLPAARRAILQARRCGVPAEEESLPGETPISAA
jgi:class 3 adenylate cyclase